MTLLTQPILEINLNSILENYRALQAMVQPAICAVVIKDNAYGLGADIIAPYLYNEVGCRHFWVAHAVEGQAIIQLIPKSMVYVLQGIGSDNLEIFQKNPQLIPVINSPQEFAFWKENKTHNIKPIINIETGLNRLGFREKELSLLSTDDLQEFSIVMSHLACAGEKDHFMNMHQLNNFRKLKKQYFPKLPSTLSASDGVFLGGEFKQDMVRLGAALYGINIQHYNEKKLKNVVKIKAPVLQIEKIYQGDFVGYSATYCANNDGKIAVISVGFADGFPRSLSNKGKVFFKNNNKVTEARVIGRVSMDNIVCDVSHIENLSVGDMAYILDDFYTLDDMGRDVGNGGCEIISRFGKNPRFTRFFIGRK